MEINIPLPQSTLMSTYREIQGYLKQLELAIHHAQKSVEAAEKAGVEITEDSYVNFQHPAFASSLQIDEKNKEIPDSADGILENYYEELQNIELSINLN